MPTQGQGGVNDAEALAEIRRLARLARVVITPHARKRMIERFATEQDVYKALRTATAAVRQEERGNWRVAGGVDLDGDDLTLICDLDNDVVVVTVF